MDEGRAQRVVDALRERGVNARMEKAGVYQFGISIKVPGGRTAVWDSDGTAGLEAVLGKGSTLAPEIDLHSLL